MTEHSIAAFGRMKLIAFAMEPGMLLEQKAKTIRAAIGAIRRNAMARSKTDLDPEVVADHKLPSARLSEALGLLQDAHAKIQRAAEQLQIVDSTMIGSDEHRRLIVASSAENPIGVADDIRSHQTQAVEISDYAAEVRKAAQAVKGKGAFLAQALGSVYRDEIQAGDVAREKKKPQQDMFRQGTDG